MQHVHTEALLGGSYWVSPEGLQKRLAMLGEDFCYNVVNNSLQVYGRKNEVAGWVGIPGNAKHCDYCLDHIIDHFFRLGQFLPRLPAHGHCVCTWRMISK